MIRIPYERTPPDPPRRRPHGGETSEAEGLSRTRRSARRRRRAALLDSPSASETRRFHEVDGALCRSARSVAPRALIRPRLSRAARSNPAAVQAELLDCFVASLRNDEVVASRLALAPPRSSSRPHVIAFVRGVAPVTNQPIAASIEMQAGRFGWNADEARRAEFVETVWPAVGPRRWRRSADRPSASNPTGTGAEPCSRPGRSPVPSAARFSSPWSSALSRSRWAARGRPSPPQRSRRRRSAKRRIRRPRRRRSCSPAAASGAFRRCSNM